MTARVALNNMRNFPVKTCFAYEGTVTRYDVVSGTGGKQEDVAVYSAPIAKGDLVRLYASEDTVNRITVEKAAAGDNKDYVHGIAVSDPQGVDNITATSGTPVDSLQRRVDVAFFGLGIIELEANGAIPVGSGVEISESESNIVGDDGTDGENGGWIAMTLGADGTKISILVGFSGYLPAD
jgi:hypothetical protein